MTKMNMTLISLAFVGLIYSDALAQDNTPPKVFDLQISTNSTHYALYEPLILTASVTNITSSTATLMGPSLKLRNRLLKVRIRYQSKEVWFVPARISKNVGMMNNNTLGPGASTVHTEVLMRDNDTGRFICNSAGEYRIQAEYSPLDLVSNEVVVNCATSPGSLLAIAEEFRVLELNREFAPPESVKIAAEDIQAASQFVAHASNTIYGQWTAASLSLRHLEMDTPGEAPNLRVWLDSLPANAFEGTTLREQLQYLNCMVYMIQGQNQKAYQAVLDLKRKFLDGRWSRKFEPRIIDNLQRKAQASVQ